MISAPIGDRLKVIGRSIAMAATGPMPGSTPISVPRITPIAHIRTLNGTVLGLPPTRRAPRPAHLVVHLGHDGEKQSEPDKHQSGPEVLRTLDLHSSSPPPHQRSA